MAVGLDEDVNALQPHHVADEQDEISGRQLRYAVFPGTSRSDIVRYEVWNDFITAVTAGDESVVVGHGAAYWNEAVHQAAGEKSGGAVAKSCH